ncbi:hypothetical protein NKG94_02660 [Micromonospora sp. M12]
MRQALALVLLTVGLALSAPAVPAVAVPDETGRYYVVGPPVNGQRSTSTTSPCAPSVTATGSGRSPSSTSAGSSPAAAPSPTASSCGLGGSSCCHAMPRVPAYGPVRHHRSWRHPHRPAGAPPPRAQQQSAEAQRQSDERGGAVADGGPDGGGHSGARRTSGRARPTTISSASSW